MRPVRTLIVDDSEDIRLLLRLMLHSDPAVEACGEAANGKEAVDLAARLSPDAIVLDVMMPVMDGLTALPLLRQACPNAKIVLLTASPHRGTHEGALALGACAVLIKGNGARELIETLTSPCERISPVA